MEPCAIVDPNYQQPKKILYAVVKVFVNNICQNVTRKEEILEQVKVISLFKTREDAIIEVEKELNNFPIDRYLIQKKNNNTWRIVDIQKIATYFSQYRKNEHVYDICICEVE